MIKYPLSHQPDYVEALLVFGFLLEQHLTFPSLVSVKVESLSRYGGRCKRLFEVCEFASPQRTVSDLGRDGDGIFQP